MNVISNSNLSSVKSNLDINNTYNSVNNNSNITNFRENNTFNSKVILLSNESQSRK
jgi:hypothetical protein